MRRRAERCRYRQPWQWRRRACRTRSSLFKDGFPAINRESCAAATGRQRPVRAKGSSRWPDLVAEPLTCLCAPNPPNVKFRGTADSCQRSWPTPGIGACRHSPTKSERPQSEWTGRSPGKPWSAAFGNRRHSSTKFERLQSVCSRPSSGHPERHLWPKAVVPCDRHSTCAPCEARLSSPAGGADHRPQAS